MQLILIQYSFSILFNVIIIIIIYTINSLIKFKRGFLKKDWKCADCSKYYFCYLDLAVFLYEALYNYFCFNQNYVFSDRILFLNF